MKGHKRQRKPGVWQLIVPVGKYPNGLTRYRSETFRGNERQAETALAALIATVAKDDSLHAGPVSVETVVRKWLEMKTRNLEPATIERYQTALKHIVRALGKKPVTRLRTKHIDELYSQLVESGMSGSSIRKVHGALQQSLRWAKRHGYVTRIATEGLELPPPGGKAIHPPKTTHVRKMLDAAMADDPDFGMLLIFIANTGCRRGEACGLRWDDLALEDRRKGSAVIQRSIAAVPGGIYEKGTKTRDGRVIALGVGTVDLLREHQMRCRDRAAAIGVELAGSAFVFSPDLIGEKPWHPQTISHRFTRYCRAAGVPKMRLHDLRHVSATTLLKNGASVGEVMDRHGWKSIGMVTRYRHLLEAKDRKAAEAMEQALSG